MTTVLAYEPFNETTADIKDKIAYTLCQIMDDDAPLRWTRYRFAASCIAGNKELMSNLIKLGETK